MSIHITNGKSSQGLRIPIGNYNNPYGKTISKLLSSPKRNQASNNVPRLIKSQKTIMKIDSLNREIENTTLAIKMYESADSTIGEMRNILNELRSQADVASNSGYNSPAMQDAYRAIGENLVHSFNHIIEISEYNGTKLFGRSEGALVGIFKMEGIDFSTSEKARESVKLIDASLDELSTVQIDIKETHIYNLEANRSSMGVAVHNLNASELHTRDINYLKKVSVIVENKIVATTGMTLSASSKLNHSSILKLLE